MNTPTARGGQTLVRLKIRNLITNAVFEKTFKAGDKFREPDLQSVPASYLYSDSEGSYFLDQESYETLLADDMIGNALDFLIAGTMIHPHKYNGNPIGLQLPPLVELDVAFTESGARGDTSSGTVTKPARLETGLEIRVPLFIKEGEKVKCRRRPASFPGGHEPVPDQFPFCAKLNLRSPHIKCPSELLWPFWPARLSCPSSPSPPTPNLRARAKSKS